MDTDFLTETDGSRMVQAGNLFDAYGFPADFEMPEEWSDSGDPLVLALMAVEMSHASATVKDEIGRLLVELLKGVAAGTVRVDW